MSQLYTIGVQSTANVMYEDVAGVPTSSIVIVTGVQLSTHISLKYVPAKLKVITSGPSTTVQGVNVT